MSQIAVQAAGGSYPVFVVRDYAPTLTEVHESLSPSKTLIVSDPTVSALHLQPVLAVLGAATPVEILPTGEAGKNPASLQQVWEACRTAGLDRHSLIVSLGGGVVGDVAGFAAATYMRGIRIVHLPTTLLAQVDSAVGGKTAVNLGAKNLVGAFHQPAGVIANLSVLSTLPTREVRSGLGEIWKTGVLVGESLLSQLEASAKDLVALNPDALESVVLACVQHKAGVVERDERESGERALLNLGHTLGHALELHLGDLSHGEAITVGGVFACALAERRQWLDEACASRFETLARLLELPVEPTRRLDVDAIMTLVSHDKKAKAGVQRWVLPRGPGHCELTPVEPTDVRTELSQLGWAL